MIDEACTPALHDSECILASQILKPKAQPSCLAVGGIWEFPKKRGPSKDPNILSSLLQGLPKRGPKFSESPISSG